MKTKRVKKIYWAVVWEDSLPELRFPSNYPANYFSPSLFNRKREAIAFSQNFYDVVITKVHITPITPSRKK